MMGRSRPVFIVKALLAALLWSTASALPTSARAETGPALTVLSSAPERVSGGDALVSLALNGAQSGEVRLLLNGKDVTPRLLALPGSDSRIGLVDGLVEGRNILTAVPRRGKSVSLVLTNFPITGPIFSGPQIKPYICQTDRFTLPDGSNLGAALDRNCSARTKVIYLYKSTKLGRFLPLATEGAAGAAVSDDVASVTTLDGKRARYVVRFEAGTIDRGVYNIAVLHDPAKDAPVSAISAPAGWARRLLWVHGFGCPGGWYYQGTNTGSLDGIYPQGAPRQNTVEAGFNVMRDEWLSKGYAIATSTLNHPSISCNPILAAEATAMVKEHFIEQFGVPLFTLSTGSSGGAYSSLQIADAFPGLFDGVLIGSVFPDALSIALSGMDGHLLTHYFAQTGGSIFSESQKVAISGYSGMKAFTDAANQAGRTDPVTNRQDLPGYVSGQWNVAGAYPEKQAVPEALRYDPAKNPRGARPTIFDVSANIYGRDPATGFARRPFDNEGVQYGLAALNAGTITPAQFLELNANVGGYDQDGNYVQRRSRADAGVLRRVYTSGMTLSGTGGLKAIPIFDFAGYNETAQYHYQWFRFAVRERLVAAGSGAANHVMWRAPTTSLAVPQDAIAAMDRWMVDYRNDLRPGTPFARVVRNKPADLVDGCADKAGSANRIAEPQVFGRQPVTRCNTLWPSFSDPRQIAGGPLSAAILKCQLKPVDPADYLRRLTAAEFAWLQGIFPSGVCDWGKPGVGQAHVTPWASFGPSQANLIQGSN